MKKWKSILKNGDTVTENVDKSNWLEIKDQVASLEFDNNGQIITLPPNMQEYIQGKTASADLISGKCTVESRFVGFKIGNSIVKIRVNEKTDNITIEIN